MFSTIFSFIKKPTFTLPHGFTITAHTGCEGTPDNSLDSIRAGVAAGADIVEIDLHFLPDGTPVSPLSTAPSSFFQASMLK